jgi:hypothetical protein
MGAQNKRQMHDDQKAIYCIHIYMSTMSTTIRIKEERKHTLQQFLASLFLEEGVKLNEQDALGELIDFGVAHKDEFVRQVRKTPLEKDAAWRMLSKPVNWGVRDAAENVDKYLYGLKRQED